MSRTQDYPVAAEPLPRVCWGGWVEALSFSPDNRTLVSGSWNRNVQLWDLESGLERTTFNDLPHPVLTGWAETPDGWTERVDRDLERLSVEPIYPDSTRCPPGSCRGTGLADPG